MRNKSAIEAPGGGEEAVGQKRRGISRATRVGWVQNGGAWQRGGSSGRGGGRGVVVKTMNSRTVAKRKKGFARQVRVRRQIKGGSKTIVEAPGGGGEAVGQKRRVSSRTTG